MKKAEEVVRGTRSFHNPEENTLVRQQHHYLSGKKVAKLFESNSKKEPEGEPMFKATTQSLNSFIYFRNKHEDIAADIALIEQLSVDHSRFFVLQVEYLRQDEL